MTIKKRTAIGGLFFVGALLFSAIYFLSRPSFFVESNGRTVLSFGIKPGEQVSLHYIHSVQKTPVIENIVVEPSGKLTVVSTEYQSFGVGLPFLASEGNFRIQGDTFILEGMHRSYDNINLRVGPEAQLTLQYDGNDYALYQTLPPGALVTLRVAPYYSKWF